MNFILKLIVSTFAVFVAAKLLPGVRIENDSVMIAIMVAVVLSFLNAVVKPIMILLTIPVTFFTLGFFLLVINAFMIMLASILVKEFVVDGFWYALLFSIVLSIITSILNKLGQQPQNDNTEE